MTRGSETIGYTPENRVNLDVLLGRIEKSPIELQAAIFTRMVKKL